MKQCFKITLLFFALIALVSGCAVPPNAPPPSIKMCSSPIGTAYIESGDDMLSVQKILNRTNYPEEEIERMLIETNCFKMFSFEKGNTHSDILSSIYNNKPKSPKADYRISASIVFTETGSSAGYMNPYARNSILGYATQTDKQNGRATIRITRESDNAVMAIATGEGVYQDAQYFGQPTNRSEARVLEFAFRNAINNMVGRINHLSK